MKANELQINNFLQAPNVQFVIPVYQRNYDWKNAECKELLNDIILLSAQKKLLLTRSFFYSMKSVRLKNSTSNLTLYTFSRRL